MWTYCQLWSRSIEVVYKAPDGSEILNRVYFPHDPQVYFKIISINNSLHKFNGLISIVQTFTEIIVGKRKGSSLAIH